MVRDSRQRASLEELRAAIPEPQGLEYDTSRERTGETESPFFNAIAECFSAQDYQRIRSKAAEHIAALTE